MKRLKLRLLVTTLLILIAQPSVAQEGPVTLFDVRVLRIQEKSHAEIIAAIRERGLGFKVDKRGEQQLRSYGFSPRQIGQLKELPQPKSPDQPPKPAAAEPARPAIAKDAPKPAQPRGPQIEPAFESRFARLADQVVRMLTKSQVDAKQYPSQHITLVSNKKLADRYLPDVAKIERLLKDRFPEPIASGVDRRAANIALFETRYEYEKWVRALFAVFAEDGIRFNANDAEERSVASSSFFVKGIYSVCLEGMGAEEAGRRVAFAVGFQYMRQLSRYQAPDPLATGFGNITEVMLYKRPSVMVKSGYVDRQLGGLLSRWAEIVRRRFAAGEIASIQNVLAFTTAAMEAPEYAVAWSMTCLLATNEDKLAKLVLALRAKPDAWGEISRIYEVDEAAFLAKWRRFARSVN